MNDWFRLESVEMDHVSKLLRIEIKKKKQRHDLNFSDVKIRKTSERNWLVAVTIVPRVLQ